MLTTLFALLLILPLWAQEPAPLSFDDAESLNIEESSPSFQRAVRKRSEAISTVESAALAVELPSADRYDLRLKLAHLQHEQARATRDETLLLAAAQIYGQLYAESPRHPQAAHVLFFLGFALHGLGEASANDVLYQVLTTFPSSEYVPHALLHTGESEFANERWEHAAGRYEVAAEYTFPFRDFALYKLAWTHRKRGDTRAAVDTMTRAIESARPGLAQVALTALTYWSEEQGWSVDPALGTPRAQPTCLDDIPGQRAAIAAQPMAPQALSLQHDIVRCVDERAAPMLQAELRRLISGYGRDSNWWKLQDKSTRRQAKELLRTAEARLP
ncbi:MAG: tetratricopeptide repeat protein [Proteobacteria bacterium]|nr:tetratricopeptide repeat protein [Pseudomonadota bacterium]